MEIDKYNIAAKELIERFENVGIPIYNAKICAIIAISEIRKALLPEYGINSSKQKDWEEIYKIINNLK